MKFKYSKVNYNDPTFAVVLVKPIIAKAPSIGNVRQFYSNALNINAKLIVLASEMSDGNIEYIYGQENVINIIKNHENGFVWEIYEGL